MSSLPTLNALLIDVLKDLFHAENQLLRLLQATLDEEGETNKALTKISDSVNADDLFPGEETPVARKSKK